MYTARYTVHLGKGPMKILMNLLILTGVSIPLYAVDSKFVLSFAKIVNEGNLGALETFKKELNEHALVVVKCSRRLCNPCKILAPKFEKIAKLYHGKGLFLDLDVLQFSQLTMPYHVKSVPTILVFSHGKLAKYLRPHMLDELPNIIEELTKIEPPKTDASGESAEGSISELPTEGSSL